MALGRRRTVRLAAAGVAGVAAGFLAYAWRNARRVHVTCDDLFSPRLPAAFEGARLVFLSDVHAGLTFTRRQVAALVDTVNGLEPDILVLGGDYVGGYARGWQRFYPEAERFRASLGRYAVLGNHDVWEGADDARRGLAEAGIRLLENEAAAIELDGQRIHVCGLDDVWTGHPDWHALASQVPDGDFAVLATHNPDVLDEVLPATPGAWDLALAGHTHGGQLVFRGRPVVNSSRFGRRYYTGWTAEEGVPILVSNGVGTVTVPLRHAADSQVHVITLRRARE